MKPMHKTALTGALAALMMSAAPAAYAAGTDAGTLITNTISMSYNSGSETVSDSEAASASFTVDRKVVLLLESQEESDVLVDLGDPANDDGATMAFQLSNSSNDTVGYAFEVTAPSGFSHDGDGGVNTYRILVDGDPYAPGDSVDAAADADLDIQVIAEFAADSDGEDYEFSVKAIPQFAESSAADIADLDTLSTVWVFDEDADDSDSATFSVNAPSVAATKEVAVISADPDFDCADTDAAGSGGAAIPGACIEYTIEVSNTGGAAARNLSIVDALPSGISYAASAGAFFSISESGGTVTADAGSNLTNGESETLRIRATID